MNFGRSGAIWLFYNRANQMYGVASNSSGTSYSNPVLVSGSPNITSPVTAFTPDNNIVMAYARRQSDGHLVQLRWVGSTAPSLLDPGVGIM